MSRYETAADIINGAASECGLIAVTDPYASNDSSFIQLRTLLSSGGQEMLVLHQWQKLVKRYQFTTVVPPDTGNYDMPADLAYMIDQTGWTPTNGGAGLPLGGPLSEQDWTYLVNTNLANATIYVSFKIANEQLQVLPQPPPNGVIINFEYISRWWVADPSTTVGTKTAPTQATDVVLYEPVLIKKFLKLRFLEAKGFDTTAAVGQFLTMFNAWTGRDTTAQVLNMARSRFFPYLGYRNIPETNYGLP